MQLCGGFFSQAQEEPARELPNAKVPAEIEVEGNGSTLVPFLWRCPSGDDIFQDVQEELEVDLDWKAGSEDSTSSWHSSLDELAEEEATSIAATEHLTPAASSQPPVSSKSSSLPPALRNICEESNASSCAGPNCLPGPLSAAVAAASPSFSSSAPVVVRPLSAFETRYEVLEVVGRGAFAVVHRARNLAVASEGVDDPIVAVKILELSKGSAATQMQEVELWAGLDHPNIVRLHGCYRGDHCSYLVADFCGGQDLHTYIDDHVASIQRYRSLYNSGLSSPLAARVLVQMLSGVEFLHGQGVVHRDIKPENYLLTSKGAKDPCVKLTDFGLAARLPTDGSPLRQKVGTPFYVAPEVLAGSYDEKADLFSLGVTGFVACTWHLPFSGVDEAEYDRNAVAGKRRKGESSWWADHTETRLRTLVDTCLIADPTNRPSAEQLLLDNVWLEKSDETTESCIIF